MTPVELYQKLRPFLRVQVCSHSWHHKPYEERGLRPWPHRVGAAAVIRWCPGEAPPNTNWLDRPTYEQFCHWYNLDPGEGLA